MTYSIILHKHRFAAWAASRAASVNGHRFPVKTGRNIIDGLELINHIINPDTLPAESGFDSVHREWRQKAIELSNDLQSNGEFTHGVAAKLINIYFKSSLVCAGYHNHPKVKKLHPPIDRIVLDGLKRNNVGNLGKKWAFYQSIGWTNFDSAVYEDLIGDIRGTYYGKQCLWWAESYWTGHQ